jgi:hypothetical protein
MKGEREKRVAAPQNSVARGSIYLCQERGKSGAEGMSPPLKKAPNAK